MNHYAVAGLLTFSVSLVIAFIVYFRSPKRAVNKFFALFSITVALYGFGFFKQAIASTSAQEMLAIRINLFGTIFMPIFFLRSVYWLLEKRLSFKTLAFLYGIGIFFEAANASTNWFAKDPIPRLGFNYLFQAGFLYPALALGFLLCIVFCLVNLFKGYRRSSGLRRNQLKYLFWAALIGFSGGSAGFALGYDINLYPFNPFGAYFVFVGNILLAYAIVTYRLMDITFAIRDTTVRLASSLIPAAIFIAIGMAFFSPKVMIAMIILTAITSPLLYGPLRRLLLPVILGGKYGYQQKLRRISDKWFSIFSLDRLSESLVKDVANTIGTKYCNFMIYDEEGKSYFVKANAGFKEGEEIEDILFKEESPLVSYLKKEKTIAIKEVLKIQPPFSQHDPIIREMDRVKAAISVPLHIDDELKGVLNLGDKLSGEMYNRQDLEILSQIARDAEVMFRYSFFNYEQSLLVYRYSHDLRTPLDPVQTYLYLMQQGKLNEEEKEKYLKIVRKNIDFVAQGLSDMYQLSQMAYEHVRKKFLFSHFNIIEMVKRIVEDFTPEAKKKEISLRLNRKERLPLAYGHEQSIERLIRNLIQNGIKFTDKGGIEISISSEKEDIRIKVSDTGPGIPKKDLPRIFNPFFKTKGRDQIVEGSGLGLTIVREIVALHAGEINVESEVGKGTTFTILLPAFKKRKIRIESSKGGN